jgi:branched-chain amino acid transport system substrate-binding protein
MTLMNLLATAGAVAALNGSVFAQQTIKLGVVNIDTGPLTVSAGAINDGASFAVETLNAQGGALGRRYELVVQNHEGTPAAAIAAATKLVQQQGVSFFTGLNPSGNSLAISAKLADLNALFIDATAASDDLTGKNCNANYFRLNINDSTQVGVLRDLAKQSGAKSWDLLLADMAAARDMGKKFSAMLPELGATVQKTVYAPLATTDHGSSIGQLIDKPAEGLLVYFPGSAGIGLSKQQAPFGLYDKYKMVLSGSMVNEILIVGQGDTTVGLWSSQSYFWDMPGAANAAFVKAFETRFGRKPSYLTADAYLSFMLVHAAIVKAQSTDVAAVRTALSGLKTTTIVGEVEMRAADHQLLRPAVVVQAVKAAPGKGEIEVRMIEPVARTTPPLSAECRM